MGIAQVDASNAGEPLAASLEIAPGQNPYEPCVDAGKHALPADCPAPIDREAHPRDKVIFD